MCIRDRPGIAVISPIRRQLPWKFFGHLPGGQFVFPPIPGQPEAALCAAPADHDRDPAVPADLKPGMNEKRGLPAVSYTHLDVYKRQVVPMRL